MNNLPDNGKTLIYFYNAHDSIYRHFGFEDNPWVSSSQFKTGILDRDTFGINTGFKVSFPVYLNEDAGIKDSRVVVERPEMYSVFVNGHEVERDGDKWYLDKGTGLFKAGEYLTAGENLISIIAKPFSVKMELAPVFLTGDFGVVPSEKSWEVTAEMPVTFGSWKTMAMPFYPGDVEYTKIIRANQGMKARVILGKWYGTCATVKVNGEVAAVLGWPPYETDITGLLAAGENRVSVTVTGSLKNLIGPFHNVKTVGIVTPWSFKYAPENQPEPAGYDLIDYGLFEDFRIMTE